MSRLSDLSFRWFFLVTIGVAAIPVSSYTSQAQEHPGCWAYTDNKNFVNLNSMCDLPLEATQTFKTPLRLDSGNLINSGVTNTTPNSSSTTKPRERKCEYPWQLDSAGRRCGKRAFPRSR